MITITSRTTAVALHCAACRSCQRVVTQEPGHGALVAHTLACGHTVVEDSQHNAWAVKPEVWRDARELPAGSADVERYLRASDVRGRDDRGVLVEATLDR